MIEPDLSQARLRKCDVESCQGKKRWFLTRSRSLLILGNGDPVIYDGCGRGDQRDKLSELSSEVANVVVELEENVCFGLLGKTSPRTVFATIAE